MQVLVIGSGGREHALAWKIRLGGGAEKIYCAPGNGGTAVEGENIALADGDIPGLVNFARNKGVDLVIPGPELPLTLGVTDAMQAAGIRCFGPSQWCAQLEGSKSFAKRIMDKAGVPTAACAVFDDAASARNYIREKGAPIVVKADGLAAGKGVVVAKTEAEALEAVDRIMGGAFGEAGSRVVIEEFLAGEEVSLLAICSGRTALPLPSAQDHKAAFDGDTGPNTGGMGAYSPAPILPDSELEHMADIVIRPILRVMDEEGHPFVGILYAGLMITNDGPKVLEYNVRFGDPECQPLLMRLENSLLDVMQAAIDGKLDQIKLAIRPQSALGVVLAADGYPGSYGKGMDIEGIETAEALPGVKVFQAGTKREGEHTLSNGGRVLCVTALAPSLAGAKQQAYRALHCVQMDQSRFRTDIGDKGIRRLAKVSPKVAIFMGSTSDEPIVAPCTDVLHSLGIPFLFTVSSAHRTPQRTAELVDSLEEKGCQVYICAAGMAAHLAGAVAARTLKPVIGIPVSSSALGGMDALLSTVQMPPGFPVATVSMDKAGAKNAAWLAAEILALQDAKLTERIAEARAGFRRDIEKASAMIEKKYSL